MLEDKQKRDKYLKIITIILIIIIIMLLFFCKFGFINNFPIPTGNVDVFDIDVNIDYGDTTDKNRQIESETSDNNYKIGRRIPKYNGNTDEDIIGKVYVDDTSGNYLYHQYLPIFENAAFRFINKIAPGVSNTYHFAVHNSSKINLRYYIEMDEESEYPVNLRYRLKSNNNYIIGNDKTWVTAEELKTAFKFIGTSSSDSYSLEWKWFDEDDRADTIAGEKMKSLYKLKARFYFEAVGA